MHQIVYTSSAAAGFQESELFRIIEQSARNNPALDVTGFLLYRRGRFLQLIEGPRERLHTLCERLREDTRHADLRVSVDEPIRARRFPRWRMKRLANYPGDAAAAQICGEVRDANDLITVPTQVYDFMSAAAA